MSANVFIRSALSACTLVAAMATGASAAMAQPAPQTLRIGLSSEPTAMDPHYHQVTPNDAMTSHVFETLVGQDAKMNLVPRLATAWKAVDDTTWEFTLRQGVKFSNGQPFTADSIGSALAGRMIGEHLRSMGVPTSGPPPFSAADRSRFLQALDAAVVRARREAS